MMTIERQAQLKTHYPNANELSGPRNDVLEVGAALVHFCGTDVDSTSRGTKSLAAKASPTKAHETSVGMGLADMNIYWMGWLT
jgi:hypothetical protein